MSSDNLTQLLQRGLRVTLGATASLVEVLQDPQKRSENLAKLQQEWSQLSEEWAARGEVTEQEARDFVDRWFQQRSGNTPGTPPSADPTSTPAAPPNVQLEIQELTARIAAMRAELEKMRENESK